MADDRRDDAPDDRFEDEEFRAFAEVRSALEAVEREQGAVRRERRRLRGQIDALLSALREDAVVLVFDRDRELIDASGCVRDSLGIGAGDLVADFENFADEETVEALDEANRAVLEGEPEGACVSDGFLKAGDEELATTFVHVARTDADGEISGIEAIGIIAPAAEADGEQDDPGDPFEPLLEHIARRLLADPSAGGIERAVRTLGDFLVADRVVVNEYDEADRAFSVMAAWFRPGVSPLPAEDHGISISELPWAYSALGAGESIIISASADLPPDARREKELYAGDDASSSLLVPILRHETLAGFVSIQSVAEERTWDETDAARGRLFGIILTAALAQADAERALTQAREEAALASAARAEIETALADARDEVQRLEAGRTTAQSEIEALENQETSLREQLDEAREEAEEARREVEEAQRKHSGVNSELEKREDEAARLRQRAEDAAAEASSVRSELDELRQRFAESEREIAELRAGAAVAAARAFSSADDDDVGPAGWSFDDPDEQPATLQAADDGADDDDASAPAWKPAAAEDPARESGFDPDATIEMTSASGRRFGFDPDATVEMDATHAAAFAPGAADDDDLQDDPQDDPSTNEPAAHADAGERREEGFGGALEPTQSGTVADTDGAGRWKDDKVSWEDSTDEVPLPRFLDAEDDGATEDGVGAELEGSAGGGATAPEFEEFEVDTEEEEKKKDDRGRFVAFGAAPGEVDEPYVDAGGGLESDHSAPESEEDEDADGSASRPWWRRRTEDHADEAEGASAMDATELEGALEPTPEAHEGALEPTPDAHEVALEPTPDAHQVADLDAAQQPVAGWEEPRVDDAGAPDDADGGGGLPGLPGVDVERGLAEVGGNVELYRNLLTKFRADYHGAADKIASAIDKGNIEVAHLLLHAVKGVAGVLGAERVRENADELETQLIGGDPSATRTAVDGFSGALREMLESIEMLDGNTFALLPETAPPESEPAAVDEPETVASSSSEGVSDPLVLRSYLSGLRPHIAARKPRQCMLVMREVTSRDWTDEYNGLVTELADLIEGGDFETATDSYQELMERLERA